MATIGLGPRWRCLLANDFDAKKEKAYRLNFPPADEFTGADVFDLTVNDLPGRATMAWASFPCQDLSLAGKGRGLDGDRSGSFWGFWRLMKGLIDAGRTVPIIALENVTGAISANKGEDFRVLLETLTTSGYRVGPMVINAVHFIPQSRPRLFIIGVRDDYPIPGELIHEWPAPLWHPDALRRAYGRMPKFIRDGWIWWRTPAPPPRQSKLIDVIEEEPTGVQWHTPAQTQRLLDLMSDLHRDRVRAVQATGKRTVGTIYKRIRRDKEGNRVQRAEIRLDDVSGCLRTALGGSSRQIVMIIEGDQVQSRLLSPREGARLMGLPDSYILPEKYNEAFNLLGDGLAVPVVSWLERYIFTPLAEQAPPPKVEHSAYLEFAVDNIAVGL